MSHKEISGESCIMILCKWFDFEFVSQRGSHVKLVRSTNGKNTAIVPLKRNLKIGTLKGILKLAKVDQSEFEKHL